MSITGVRVSAAARSRGSPDSQCSSVKRNWRSPLRSLMRAKTSSGSKYLKMLSLRPHRIDSDRQNRGVAMTFWP